MEYLDNYTKLEMALMDMLLYGDNPVLEVLRRQYRNAIVVKREINEYDYEIVFNISGYVEKTSDIGFKSDFCFGDVEMSTIHLESGAGFLLWVTNGVLDSIEGYTYGEKWPKDLRDFDLRYIGGGDRDINYLENQWKIGN